MALEPLCIKPITLPLTPDFDVTTLRKNSRAITKYVRSKLWPAIGWPLWRKQIRARATKLNEEIIAYSDVLQDCMAKPELQAGFLDLLTKAYTDQLRMLSECEEILAYVYKRPEALIPKAA